ncbi:DUF190 domain-containing protein [Methanococcoides methylutens]|uniref:Uncharacterized protein n=1 Tax=Methanococcoides methylutens MM1 TaxID=1434104 RepID=A0A0E3SS56_METMT|nr:DUF190 domain-containing protein [Methanococcoides methylutens]AKB85956.1 hypothetical protein MCMEM_1903 [Methanococcoides methylutens MM1]
MRSAVLRIYLSENDRCNGRPAHEVILEFMRDSKIAGATVFHGIEGYGVHSKIHTTSILRLGTDLPMILEAVDSEEKIRKILPELCRMVPKELITLQQVEIISGEKI